VTSDEGSAPTAGVEEDGIPQELVVEAGGIAAPTQGRSEDEAVEAAVAASDGATPAADSQDPHSIAADVGDEQIPTAESEEASQESVRSTEKANA
jgi:hypothetical protein